MLQTILKMSIITLLLSGCNYKIETVPPASPPAYAADPRCAYTVQQINDEYSSNLPDKRNTAIQQARSLQEFNNYRCDDIKAVKVLD